jgi:hypothetical protein
MTQTTSMLWKEWRESRVYLWIGLGIFLGLPLIGGIEEIAQKGTHWFGIYASPWVLPLGGVLAVLTGVGITSPDMRPKLEDFWRSRPVSVGRWIGIKYLVGLTAVLAACELPLLAEEIFRRRADNDPMVLLTFFPFFWAAIYSVAFLSGCLVARAAHAATIALAAMLLIYLLPVVLPPLRWMNVADFTEQYLPWGSGWWKQWTSLWGYRQFGFVGGMIAVSVVSAGLSLLSVVRMWRIESGQKMLYGAVSAALLLLFASAAFQLGTNLPVIQQVELKGGADVQSIFMDGNHGYVMGFARWNGVRQMSTLRQIEVVGDRINVGTEVQTDAPVWQYYARVSTLKDIYWLEQRDPPKLSDDTGSDLITIVLHTSNVRGGMSKELKLWQWKRMESSATLWLWRDRLYVYGNRLDVLDVGNPDQPRVISDEPFEVLRAAGWPYGESILVPLPPIPDLPTEERLAAAIHGMNWSGNRFDGRTLCLWSGDGLAQYRLDSRNEQSATFIRDGQYKATFLQRWFGYNGGQRISVQNGLAYDNGAARDILNSSISIYDVRNPGPINMVGHFAAPGAEVVCPLPDGRAIVGGTKLWLVGPPPKRD